MAAQPRPSENDRNSPKWKGLAFAIDGLHLLTAITSIIDVLECPPITPVPGTHPWIKGICNVRGSLYSVVDLARFLGLDLHESPRKARILVINNDELGCTLFVPKVFGLRYFGEDQAMPVDADTLGPVAPYVDKTYVQGDRTWLVVSLERLVSDERFLNVSSYATA